jgi:hypothetical protein
VRRNEPDHVVTPTPERQSVTSLPIRETPRRLTSSDQTHNAGPYVSTTQRAPQYGYSPPRSRALESESAAFARSQQGRKFHLTHGRRTTLNDDNVTEIRYSRNEQSLNRARERRWGDRSRSPARTPRIATEVTSPTRRHQHSDFCESESGGESPDDSREVDHNEVPGATGIVAPEYLPQNPGHATNFRTRLALVEVQESKNMYSICIPCWDKDLDCDHESPCRECRERGKTCAYALCPLPLCHLNIKCPAVHIFPQLPLDDRKVGTSMHLIALLGLERSVIQSYDIAGIQAMHDNASSAQSVYVKVQEEIKVATQQKKKFDEHAARQLLKSSDKAPKMSGRRLDTTASMIEKLVEQQT